MKIQKENIGARTRYLWPAAVGSGAYTLCENIKIKRIFEQRISNSQEYQDKKNIWTEYIGARARNLWPAAVVGGTHTLGQTLPVLQNF